MVDKTTQCIALHAYVRIDKGDQTSACCFGASVSRERRTVRRPIQPNQPIGRFRNNRGIVTARVIDNDQLPRVSWQIACLESVNALLEKSSCVMCRNDY
jgi:hypothetical protein